MLYNQLSMPEKAAIIKVCVKNGITSLKDVETAYNNYVEGKNVFDGISETYQKASAFGKFLASGERIAHKYDGTSEASSKMQLGLNITNRWKPYTIDEIVDNGAKIRQQKEETQNILNRKVNDYLTTSNDATASDKGRQQNQHLFNRATEGAAFHAAWEKDNPTLAAVGLGFSATPFLVASAPATSIVGDAIAGTTIGKGITSLFVNPYFDAAMTSLGAADAIQSIKDNEINYMTPLELLPLTRVAKPIHRAGQRTLEKSISRTTKRGKLETLTPEQREKEFNDSYNKFNFLYNLPFAEKIDATTRMQDFLNSSDYARRAALADARFGASKPTAQRAMKVITDSRLKEGNFPAKVLKKVNNDPNILGGASDEGILIAERPKRGTRAETVDHELSHYTTYEINDNSKWVDKSDLITPKIVRDIMIYNDEIAPIKTIEEFGPHPKTYKYLADIQERRARAYQIVNKAKQKEITTDEYIDDMFKLYNSLPSNEIQERIPHYVTDLFHIYPSVEGVKKFVRNFLSVSAPLTMVGAKQHNKER